MEELQQRIDSFNQVLMMGIQPGQPMQGSDIDDIDEDDEDMDLPDPMAL